MKPEPVPSAIVSRLRESAKELEEWADTHRTASLAEHEQGVLEIFRRCMGPALGSVLERALELDQPAARRLRSACPQSGTRRRRHQWRVRRPVSQCGQTPFERPTFWCRRCRRGWSPADVVLELAAHQVLNLAVPLQSVFRSWGKSEETRSLTSANLQARVARWAYLLLRVQLV